MKVGIQLPEVERQVSWREVREIANTAEEVGFDSIWVGDHLLFRDAVTGVRGPLEAWSLLAALGEATETRPHRAPRGSHLVPQSGDDRQEGGHRR